MTPADPKHASQTPVEAACLNPTPTSFATTRRLFWGVVKCLVGASLTQLFVGSFVVLGWTQRAAQRSALRTWWRRSALAASDVSFGSFALSYPDLAEHAHAPNWFFGEPTPSLPRWRRRWQTLSGALTCNIVVGVRTIFTTWVLTLPGCLLWSVAWFAGWQNSFNKGYEYAWCGPVSFIFGMVLFAAAMCYVPLAQARQAATGEWRRFFDFRVVYRVAQRRWLKVLGITLLTAGCSAVATLLKTMPVIFQFVPSLRDLGPVEALRASERYFWCAGLAIFGMLVICRCAAARVYADGLCEAYQRGTIAEDDLGEREWHALNRLGLLQAKARQRQTGFVRLAAWMATRAGQICAVASMVALWLALSVWILISEFIAKSDARRGWWNQPLIQLPWADYTPFRLREEAKKAEKAEQPPSNNNRAVFEAHARRKE